MMLYSVFVGNVRFCTPSQATPIYGLLYSARRRDPSSMYAPNFELYSFKGYTGGPKISKLGHLTILWSTCRSGPYSISVPNLKRIVQFVQKLFMGTQHLEIRSRDPKDAHLGVVFLSVRGKVSRLCPYQI